VRWWVLHRAHHLEALQPQQGLLAGLLLVVLHHLRHQLLERGGGCPAEFFVGLGGIAEQGFHLGRSEVARVDPNHHFARAAPPGFLDPLALPLDRTPAQLSGCELDEAPHALLPAGGDHEVLRWTLLLQHPPLHLHVIAGVAPVAQGIEIAHVEALVQARIDPRQAPGDLAGHERFPPPGRFVVEQNAVAGIHAVGLAVVHRDPVGVELGHPVGAAGVERGALLLGDLLHQAVELAGAGLVDPRFLAEPQHAHRLQDAQGAEGVAVGRVFRRLEAHRHVALGAQVVDLIRLHLLDDPDQVGAVRQVAVVQREPLIELVRVLIQVIDPRGVEAARPPLDAVHRVALLQQQFS